MTAPKDLLDNLGRVITEDDIKKISEGTDVPVFPRPDDFGFLDRIMAEYFKRSNAKVVVFPLASSLQQFQPDKVKIDNLYGTIEEEEIDGKRVKFDVNAYVKVEPSKQMLKRFGIDEQRDIMMTFQLSELKKLGLVTEANFRGVDIGWQVLFDKTIYEVKSSHRTNYYANTNTPHGTLVTANRHRVQNNKLGGDL